MPKRLPENIGKAVQAIRKEYGHYVEAKFMRNKYRLFEATSFYDPEAKKPKKVTRYLGWLTDQGQLIPARHNDIKTKVFNEIDRSNEQKIKELEESLKNAEKRALENGVRKKKTEKHEREILRALSMNARITVPELTKITGLSNNATKYHINNLERKYDIKYLLEINIEKFGYMNYIAFLRFKDKKPDYEEIKSQLEKIPYVQAAMTTNGIYDVVIFFIAKAASDARSDIYNLRKTAFATYGTEWNITPAYLTFGVIQLRDQFFDVFKEKVWTRTKERPRPLPDEITEIEYMVLRAMNLNAAADFSSIDRMVNIDNGRSNYAYHQLTKREVIRRATLSVKIPSVFDVIFLTRQVFYKDFLNARDKLLLDIISEKTQQFDNYSLTCDIASPAGGMMLTPIAKEEISKTEGHLQTLINGMEIETLVITGIPVGSLNHRLFDKKETSQYEVLISTYNYAPETILSSIQTKS